MNLVDIILEVSIEQLQRDWVDTKKISQRLFNRVEEICDNKSAYVTWTLKRWSENQIALSYETAIGLKSFFKRFDRYKNKLTPPLSKDINTYKKNVDIQQLNSALKKIEREESQKKEEKDVEKFKVGTIKMSGKTYEAYRLPQGHAENRQAAVILGRHVPGDKGWCTSYDGDTDERYWEKHIRKGNIYIFVNPNDRLRDKFQIQDGYYDSKPFPISTDVPVENRSELSEYRPVYRFLEDLDGVVPPEELVDIPYRRERTLS